MIDTNMQVIFTGTYIKNKEMMNSLIDGEFIKFDKMGSPIHLYAAFDIYYLHGKSVRELPFLPIENDKNINQFRYPLLQDFVDQLELINIMNDTGGNSDPSDKGDGSRKHACQFTIKTKDFKGSSLSIFSD